jgi:hypothetical protein
MLLRSVGVLLFTLGVANGFKNSSPFFLLSTQPYAFLQAAGKSNNIQATNTDTANADSRVAYRALR